MARRSYRVSFPSGDSRNTLAGIVDRPDDSSTSPVLVFSHCFTCNKDLKAIVRISRAIAEHGIAVLRFDMTGLGGSSGDFAETNFTTNLADLASAIEFANQELGSVSALMGHSFGGAASLAMASNPGTALEGLRALITLAAPSDTVHLADLLLEMNDAIEREGRGKVVIGGYEWEITAQMLADFRRHRLTDLIPAIEVPTLLFHSPTDRTVGFDHALRIFSLLRDRPGSLVSLHGADHLLVKNQADLTFVADTVAAFVNRYASRD